MASIVRAWRKAVESGRSYEAEARYLRNSDNAYRWCQVRAVPLCDESGKILMWYGSLTDIHDYKSTQLELASSERKLKETIGALPGLVWTARPDGSANFVNQYFLDYVGMKIDEVMDWGWSSALHPDDLPGLVTNWKKILASGSPGESLARLRGSDGQYRRFMFRANPAIDDVGNTRWLGINFDIEDMKRAEEGMR